MKSLYARFALWLIRPALELHRTRGTVVVTQTFGSIVDRRTQVQMAAAVMAQIERAKKR